MHAKQRARQSAPRTGYTHNTHNSPHKFGCTRAHQLLDVGGGLVAVGPRVLDGEEGAVGMVKLAALQVDEERGERFLSRE